MKLVTWNVNSIRARLPRVVAWLEEHRPDVACLQETKVEDAQFPADAFAALGYQVAHYGQRTYNGVALLSRTPIDDVTRGFGDGDPDDAARFIAGRIQGVRVVSLYVPNGQSVGSDKFRYKLAWLARCRAWLERDGRLDEPMALCGDYNIAPEDADVHDPAAWQDQVLCHPDERAALARLKAWGLQDVFRNMNPDPGLYSWWDYRQLCFPKNRGLRIDYVLCTAPLAARTQHAVIDRNARKGKEPSDHAPVVFTFS